LRFAQTLKRLINFRLCVSDEATQVGADRQRHLVRAKSRPTYAPIGPYLATGIDAMNLDVWTKLNGPCVPTT
jgi:2-keto-4-pentenoate hydratase/2-oxohepta-3-ene-1,7-dioic acid hydratase in catechol pathway